MKVYKVAFTPAEPWFFGNEKNFLFPNQSKSGSYSNSYFIKSELMPSQSAILGALRYIFIPEKKVKKDYSEEDMIKNSSYIGGESFNIDSVEKQEFGIIKKISPVFVVRDGETLIPAPFDHKNKNKDKMVNENYTPFEEYKVCLTDKGYGLAASDFTAKDELASGFVVLKDGQFFKTSDIFGSEDRVGINRTDRKGGFFKKQYCFFKTAEKDNDENSKTKGKIKCVHKYSFAVYAVIDHCELDGKIFNVTMGQGKSPFAVSFEAAGDADSVEDYKSPIEKDTEEFLSKNHNPTYFGFLNEMNTKKCKLIYCLSDAIISNPYEKTVFAATKTKDYRAFLSLTNGRVKKGDYLHRLIKAGSVFISTDASTWLASGKNANAEQIGFNNFIEINIGGNSNE